MKSKKPLISNPYFFAGALIFFAIFIASFFYFFGFTREEQKKSTFELIADSLRQENTELKKLLNAKSFSLCDTISAERKIKLAKLEEYSEQMDMVKTMAENSAYQQKEKEDAKIIVEKEADTTNNFFDIYQSVVTKALIELEKNDPKSFLEYAIATLKHDKYSYNDFFLGGVNSLYEKKLRIEKIPSVAKYLAIQDDAWKIRTANESKFSASYERKREALENVYRNNIRLIDNDFRRKIEAKQKSLGL